MDLHPDYIREARSRGLDPESLLINPHARSILRSITAQPHSSKRTSQLHAFVNVLEQTTIQPTPERPLNDLETTPNDRLAESENDQTPDFHEPCCETECQPTKTCTGANRHGNPCGAPSLNGQHLCRFHHPQTRDAARAQVSRAGATRHQPHDTATLPLRLDTPGGLQAAIETLSRMLLLGRITPQQSESILRTFNLAYRNLALAAANTRHDAFQTYEQDLAAILPQLESIEDALEQAELRRQNLHAASYRAHLQHYYTTAHSFGVLHKSPNRHPARPSLPGALG